MYTHIKPFKLANIDDSMTIYHLKRLLKRLKLGFKVYKLLIIYTNICSAKERKIKSLLAMYAIKFKCMQASKL